MIQRKAFKFRLNTNPAQRLQLARFAGCCRFVWNKCWAMNQDRLRDGQRIMRYGECDFWVKLWKKSNEYSFLKAAHSHILQQKLKDLDKAYMDGFDKNQPNKRLPRSKKKLTNENSFRYPDPKQFKINGNNIFLPKLGWFRFRQSRQIVGKPRNVTVSEYAGHWYVSIQTEQVVAEPNHPSNGMVGLDMGIARFATLSTGEYIAPENYLRKMARQLKLAQRSLSRKKRLSNNWVKQKAQVQKIHAKVAFARNNFLHHCSHHLSKNHAIIVMEDLQVNNMSRSAAGTLEKPGTQVKAKSGLNKSILDQGWGEFQRQLQYKQQWLGGEVLLVNPKNTSRRCPKPGCGHTAKENRQTQSQFLCVACGYENNADIVGAINVLRAGHAQLACGDFKPSDLAESIIGDISCQAQEPLRVFA